MTAFENINHSADAKLDANAFLSRAFSQTDGNQALMQGQQTYSSLRQAGGEMVKNGTLPDVRVDVAAQGAATQQTRANADGSSVTTDQGGRVVKTHAAGNDYQSEETTTIQYNADGQVSKIEQQHTGGSVSEYDRQSDGTYKYILNGQPAKTYDNIVVGKDGSIEFSSNKEQTVDVDYPNQASATFDTSSATRRPMMTETADGSARSYSYGPNGDIEQVTVNDRKAGKLESWDRNSDGTYSNSVYSGQDQQWQSTPVSLKTVSVDANGASRLTREDGSVATYTLGTADKN